MYGHAYMLMQPCWETADHWNGQGAKAAMLADLTRTMSPELAQTYTETEPIPGRPGWRRDKDGRERYSAAWLNQPRPA